MKINKIEVTGFGSLYERSYDVQAPITLFCGNNEAGKSTMMQFIRSMLFGFARVGSGERYEPVRGGIHGGVLTLTDEEDRWLRLERYNRSFQSSGRFGEARTVGRPGGAPSRGLAAVTCADGRSGGEELLTPLFGGLNAELFRSVFAFGLGELQTISSLQSEEISAYLYSAGWGAAGKSILEAERRIASEMEALYKPRGRVQPIAETLRSIDGLERDMRLAGNLMDQYESRHQELHAAREQESAQKSKLAELRQQASVLEKAVQAAPHQQELRHLQAELEGLPQFDAFPQEAQQRYEVLLSETERSRDELVRLKQQTERVNAELEKHPLQEDKLAQLSALERLRSEAAAYEERREEVRRLQAEQEHAMAVIRKRVQQIDSSWSIADLEDYSMTIELKDEIRRHQVAGERTARERDRHDLEFQRLQEQLLVKQEAVEQRTVEWRGRYDAAAEASNPAAVNSRQHETTAGWKLAQAEALRAKLRDWKELCKDWDYAVSRQAERARMFELVKQSGGEVRSWIWNSGSAVLLLAALVSGGWLLLKHEAAVGMLIALLGGGAALAVFASGRQLARRSERSLDSFREASAANLQQQEDLEQQRKQLKQELEELQKQWILQHDRNGQGGVEADLEDAAQVEHLLQKLKAEITQLSSASEEEKLLQERLRAAEAERDRCDLERKQAELRRNDARPRADDWRSDWRRWLESRRLPNGLSPEGALETLQLMEQAKAELTELQIRMEKQTALAQRVEQYEQEAQQLLQTQSTEDLPARIKQAYEEAALEKEKETEHGRLKETLEAAEYDRAVWLDKLERQQAKIKALFSEASAEDEENFYARLKQYERREQLIGDVKQLQHTLRAIIPPHAAEAVDVFLQSYHKDSIETLLLEVQTEASRLEQSIDETNDRIGQLRQACAELESDQKQSDNRIRLEEQRTALRQDVDRWAVLSLCSALFRKSRTLYEQEKQPGVLKRASEYLSVMTGGRYIRVLTQLGDEQIRIQREDGGVLETSQLSRGTAEQVYLSMRFALAGEYAKQMKPPIIMDDIFVNFDGSRLKNALSLVQRVAETHQILLFTCHDYVKDACSQYLSGIQCIQM